MSDTTARLLVLVAALSWSTAGLFTRVLTTDIPTTLFGRSVSGGIFLLCIFLFRERPEKLRDILTFHFGEWMVAVLAAAGMIFFISAFYYTSIGNVSFMYGSMPILTSVLSVIVLRESVDSRGVLCCLLASLGIFFIFAGGTNTEDLFGLFLAGMMALFMAMLTIAARYFESVDFSKATYLSAFIACICVIPFVHIHQVDPTNALVLTLYGFVNVGLGFGLYLVGASRIPPITAALIGLVEIPLAPIWGWALFREKSNLNSVIGGVIIMSAVVYNLLRQQERQVKADS